MAATTTTTKIHFWANYPFKTDISTGEPLFLREQSQIQYNKKAKLTLSMSSGPQGGHLSVLAHYAGQKRASGAAAPIFDQAHQLSTHTAWPAGSRYSIFILHNHIHLRHIVHV